MLTTYVITPKDYFEVFRHEQILAPLGGKVVVLQDHDFSKLNECDTDYYALLFPGEFFSLQVVDSLPLFFEFGYDVLYFYRLTIGTQNITIAPRVFKNTVKLGEDLVIDCASGLSIEKVLDGWLFYEED